MKDENKETVDAVGHFLAAELPPRLSYHLILQEGFMWTRAEVVLYGEGLEEVDEKQLAKDLKQRMPASMSILTGWQRKAVLDSVEAGRQPTVRSGTSAARSERIDNERAGNAPTDSERIDNERAGNAPTNSERIDNERAGNAPTNSERIDKQWRKVKPTLWGDGKHSGERKMLGQPIEEGEDIECLIGGHFGPDLGHASWKDGPNTLHRGIGVATNKRVLFVDKGIMAQEVAELSYRSIEAITYSSGIMFGGMRITGRGSLSLRIENVDKSEVKPFVDSVRKHLDEPEQVTVATPAAPAPSRVEELRGLAELLKDGVLTQEEFDAEKARILGTR